MTRNATLSIKDKGSSMPVNAVLAKGGYLVRGHSLYLGDAFGSQYVELSGEFVETPVRVQIQRYTQDGEAFAIPYTPMRRI